MTISNSVDRIGGVSVAEFFAKETHERFKQTYAYMPYAFHLDMVNHIAQTHLPTDLSPQDRSDVFAACWCHDLMEDCGVTRETLEDVIGKKAAEIVWRVTDETGKNRRERHEKTYPKIAADPLAVFVKLCDRLANTKYSADTDSSMLDMYQREYPQFRAALYTPGQWDDLWKDLDNVTNEKRKGTADDC